MRRVLLLLITICITLLKVFAQFSPQIICTSRGSISDWNNGGGAITTSNDAEHFAIVGVVDRDTRHIFAENAFLYGGGDNEFSDDTTLYCNEPDIEQTHDGGYMISSYYTNEYGGNVPIVTKLDSRFHRVWRRTYNTGYYVTEARRMVRTTQGNFVIVGDLLEEHEYYCPYALCTNNNGNMIWQMNSPSAAGSCRSATQTFDNGFVLYCYGSYNAPTRCVKLDSLGNWLWYKQYTSGSAIDIVEIDEHGLMLCQRDDSPDLRSQITLIRTDSAGNELWRNSYASSSRDLFARSIKKTYDGGFIVVGSNGLWLNQSEVNAILVKFDRNGQFQWYQEIDYEAGAEIGYDVLEFAPNEFVLVGTSYHLNSSTMFYAYVICPISTPQISVHKIGTNSMMLSWNSILGAGKYFVYTSSTVEGTYSCIDSVTTTNYIDTNLSAFRQRYFYVVAK